MSSILISTITDRPPFSSAMKRLGNAFCQGFHDDINETRTFMQKRFVKGRFELLQGLDAPRLEAKRFCNGGSIGFGEIDRIAVVATSPLHSIMTLDPTKTSVVELDQRGRAIEANNITGTEEACTLVTGGNGCIAPAPDGASNTPTVLEMRA